MANFRLDYIWLDGYQPTANIRTKAQIVEVDTDDISIADVPVWGFDGSSTHQAEGHDSDCILQPVRVYKNPLYDNACFVLCEVFTRAGERHESNYRSLIDDAEAEEFWFGFEQDWAIRKTANPALRLPVSLLVHAPVIHN